MTTGKPEILTDIDNLQSTVEESTNLVFGQEYLSAFHKKLMDGYGFNYGQNAITVISGDSTTKGDSTTLPYKPHTLLSYLARINGVPTLGVVNNGQSGKATFDWDNTYVQNDISANPDLLILRWGINDPYYGKNKNDFEISLRSGLTKIRAVRQLESLSIIIMVPNSVNDDVTGRNEAWVDSLRPIIRKACRDFQCCYIDTFQFLKDSEHANDWMDNPYGDGRHIHPNDVMNLWIYNLVFDIIVPKSIRDKFGASNIDNALNSAVSKLSTDLPLTYPKGISIYRALTTSGDFTNGIVYTFHSVENTLWQINTNYNSASAPSIKMRIGQSGSTNTWSVWQSMGGGTIGTVESWTEILDAELQNGWLNYGGGYDSTGYYKDNISGRVYLKGLIKSGTMTKNTLIYTLPVGYRPSKPIFLVVATNTTIGAIQIASNGNIVTWNITDNVFVSLNGISFRV